jgi:uncharacterized RDD family membrane protein YckC
MSSVAQCDETSESYLSTGTEGGAALKQIAAERLAAHRSRRAVVEGREAQARREQAEAQAAIRLQARRDAARADVHPDASRVREAVAARYQQSVSYREFLAAEAQRAMEQAQARAEVAARNATAVAEAQRQLLEEIEQWNQTEMAASADAGELFSEPPLLEVVEPRAGSVGSAAGSAEVRHAKSKVREEAVFEVSRELPFARLQVRLHEEIELASAAGTFYIPATMTQAAAEELAELDEEIEFRRAPEFEDLVLETQPIQANIIEFPRQLVASRKARPRLAEGPLREDGTPEPQLRIFEVEAEQISVEPEMIALAEAPEWQGLLLGDGTTVQTNASMSPQLEAQLQLGQQLYVASMQRRILSATVDAFCVGAGFAGFAAVAVKIAGQALRGAPLPLLGGAAAGTIVAFAVLYQLLFFTLNEATPGMRAMRLAFCTFNEKSPTGKALRRRLVSTALAACPLGLGLVWTALDSDRLGWHDRMSRMYLRSY